MSVATDKAKIASQEQEIIDLRKRLDKSTGDNERLAAEGLAKVQSLEQALQTETDHSRETELANGLLQAALDEARADVLELNELLTLAGTAPAAGAEPVLEHDGRQFTLAVQHFHLAGTDYTAADVTSGSDVLARLVACQAGILTELEPAE